MVKKINKEGWLYEYEETAESQNINGYKNTEVRYVLGKEINSSGKKVLICIGINPSTAIPEKLDPTLTRVEGYAKKNEEYRAWYMLNVYPKRKTNPQELPQELDIEIHNKNLIAIKNLLSEIKEADVWCAWGNTIRKRKYLYDLLLGNKEDGIDGIIGLFNGNYHFKAYGLS